AARASSLTLKNEKLLTHVSRQLCHISAGTSVAVVFQPFKGHRREATTWERPDT
ncbi:unnamed protein product, partial [Pylaiella littoralis]